MTISEKSLNKFLVDARVTQVLIHDLGSPHAPSSLHIVFDSDAMLTVYPNGRMLDIDLLGPSVPENPYVRQEPAVQARTIMALFHRYELPKDDEEQP